MLQAHDPFLLAPRGRRVHLPASFDPPVPDHGPAVSQAKGEGPGGRQSGGLISAQSFHLWEQKPPGPALGRQAGFRAGRSQGGLPFQTHRVSPNHSRHMWPVPVQ
jgi:hypothetical protein